MSRKLGSINIQQQHLFVSISPLENLAFLDVALHLVAYALLLLLHLKKIRNEIKVTYLIWE